MSIQFDSAKELYLSFKESCSMCNEILAESNKISPNGKSPELQRLVARFMGNSYLGVMKPIENNFPDASKENIENAEETRTNYVGPLSELYSEFLTKAKLAVGKNIEIIVDGEKSGLFRQGTLEDINNAILEIEKFAHRQ